MTKASATDELRRLLDERGVEYTANDGKHVRETCWPYMGELIAAFAEFDNGTTRFACDTWCFTPEQAIAATLGGRRLTAEQVREAIYRNSIYNDIYEAYQVSRTYMQAIADELNAALEGGECEMEYGGDVTEDTARVMGVYFCSECGSPNYNDCMPHYCIYCGKAVKR